MLVSCWRNQQFSYFPYNMRFTYNPEFSENYSQAASLHFYLLVALALLLLLGGLHKGDLSGYDDAAYAYEAKTILATGDWWTLSLNGSQDFDKPPLFVWCLAISMQVFGKSDFAAKLPAALFGFGTILLVYQLAQELTGCKWISIFSMLVLVSTQYFLKYATHAMTGVPFTFFFTLAIWLYLKGYRQSQHWLFCGFAFGAANWIRAPVGWLVIAIIVIHLLFTRQFFRLRSGWLQGGLGLGAALSLSWYVVNYLIHGKLFITEHFFNLNNHVFEVSPPLAWEQVRSLFHYPYLLLRHYWPWLPLLLIGLIGQAKKALRYQDTAASLLLIWVACILVPFSLATSKVLRYILPVFPAFSILVGMVLRTWLIGRRKEMFFKAAYGALAIVALTIIVAPAYQLRATEMKTLAQIAEVESQATERILLYTWGQQGWDYRNQFIWYSNRLVELQTSLPQVAASLQCFPHMVGIIDKQGFQKLAEQSKDVRLTILAASDNFVCFRKTSLLLPDAVAKIELKDS